MTSQQPHPFITMTSHQSHPLITMASPRPHTSGNMTSQQPPTPNRLALLRDMEDQGVNVNFDILRIHPASSPHPHPHQSDEESDHEDERAIEIHRVSYHPETRFETDTGGDTSDAQKPASPRPTVIHYPTPPPHHPYHHHPKQQSPLPAADPEPNKEPDEKEEEEDASLQEEKDLFVLCSKSPPRRQHLELPALTTRRTSLGNAIRRASLVRTGLGVEPREESCWQKSPEFAPKEKRLTDKRMAMVRDKFSSKNLFNVRRQNAAASHFADLYPGVSVSSPDSSRKATSGMALSQRQRSPSRGQRRPVTSSFTGHSGQFQSYGSSCLNNPRSATASSGTRIGRHGTDFSAIDSIFAGSRQPRSRRELEKLSQLKVDPFRGEEQGGEEGEGSGDDWLPDVHHDLLDRLRRHGPLLQQRVSSFLKDLERFNRRSHKTGLEHILEIQ